MRSVRITLILLAVLAIGFALGPRVDVDTAYALPDLPGDLEAYVAGLEARFDDIVPGTEKVIVRAGAASDTAQSESGRRTPLSVVYIHGFSGTRQMAAPLADSVASALGANLFMTRLTGHGRTGEALADATVNDWLHDAAEAVAIGRRLGDRIVLMGLSHGAAIAAWVATQPELRDDLAAVVLLSPNFEPADPRTRILLWPWGRQIADLLVGAERSWEPENEGHGTYSTTRYPTRALLPMMGFVDLLAEQDPGRITAPTFIAYSTLDRVISVPAILAMYPRIGADVKRLIDVGDVEDPSDHVIAGDILSPANTMVLARQIVDFLAEAGVR